MDQRDEQLLRRLALNDEATVASVLGTSLEDGPGAVLDGRTVALVRLAGLVALRADPASYSWAVATAYAAGATDEDLVDALVVLAPVVGVSRLSAAAREVAVAVGCSLDDDPREP